MHTCSLFILDKLIFEKHSYSNGSGKGGDFLTELSKLNHSRLIVRTKYYREKTLTLEKQLQLAETEIQKLLEKVEKLEQENALINKENHDLKTALDTNRLEKLQKENYLLLKKLDGLANENGDNNETVNQKIQDYERLLSEIQKEINAKEKEIDYYRSKVKSLEKQSRIYTSTNQMHTHKPLPTAKSTLCYFDYAIVKKSDQEFIFIGDFHIHNLSSEPIVNPKVCFRFSPPQLAALKGQIFTFEQAAFGQQISPQWMFVDSEWSDQAKERGEIWIVSTEPMSIKQGESAIIQRFQIPVSFQYSETLTIEGFVYADSDQKMKSSNNIIFTYHS